MNRLILGQRQSEIAKDMSITEARLSVIINSPLFQLELKKKQLRRAEMVLDLEENILNGANLGAKLHRDILESPKGTYPTEVKMKAATVMASIGAKLIRTAVSGGGGNGGSSEMTGKSYEERLREVTFKETIREVKEEPDVRDQLSAEDIDEADLIFGDIDEQEEREFPEPVQSIIEKSEEAPPS
jgi:hypothetical protein